MSLISFIFPMACYALVDPGSPKRPPLPFKVVAVTREAVNYYWIGPDMSRDIYSKPHGFFNRKNTFRIGCPK